jgi:peptidoglycan/LPS O-acetylase OafA/YrhL
MDTAKPEEKNRSIASLDGLRALSVFAVILGHTQSDFLDRIPFNAVFRNGNEGVAVFFVISGFLITHLLVKELRREGRLNLKRFYLRRTFRIFPPFYAFIAVVLLLNLYHDLHITPASVLAAVTYTWNYVPRRQEIWTLGHCWSLTLEEQFYLLWPVCMAFFSRKANFRIAIGVIALSPLSRFVSYYLFPGLRENLTMMLHTRLDTIMMGCLLALLVDSEIWPRVKDLVVRRSVFLASLIFLAAVDPLLDSRFKGKYNLTLGISLENLTIAAILLYVVFRSESFPGRILNLRLLKHLGVISYSLYLWQQLFTGPDTRLFPFNIMFIVVCAELSYFIVELPSFRIRDVVQRRFMATQRAAEKALAPEMARRRP